jgi:hypothetical protein
MSTELILCAVLAFASVVLILAHERGREAAATLWAGALLYFLTRTKAPTDEPITPKPIERVTNDEIHAMDDAASSLPADTVSADELREWARDDVRD